MSGFLYILSNPNMPGLVKVGKTTRDPSNRVEKLSAASGVPTTFMVVHHQPVKDCHAAKLWVHSELERRGYRPNADREFFMAPTQEVVELINLAGPIVGVQDEVENLTLPDPSDEETRNALAKHLDDLENECYYETDSVSANPARALEYFEQAAALGNIDAAMTAGIIYEYGEGSVPKSLEKALRYCQQAVAGGKWEAIPMVASILMESNHCSAAEQYWVQYFDAAIDALARNCSLRYREHIHRHVGVFGSIYISKICGGEIAAVVAPEKLSVFRDALIRQLGELAEISDEYVRRAYMDGLEWLQSQLALIDANMPPE
jgi:hypothetical protein